VGVPAPPGVFSPGKPTRDEKRVPKEKTREAFLGTRTVSLMGACCSSAPALPEDARGWWILQRGRGRFVRTISMPFWGRIFVPVVVVQMIVLITLNTVVAVLLNDCLATMLTVLSSLGTIFMTYFAVEAVRTDNIYQ
jgi:hypothetical protein